MTRPWDPPGLPPRTEAQRCANHSHCAYRDDDPERCPWCHRPWSMPSVGCRTTKAGLHPPDPQAR